MQQLWLLPATTRPRRAVKLVFIISALDVGGAEIALLKLLERINPATHSVQVISLTTLGPIGERIGKLGVAVEALGMRRSTMGLHALARVIRLLRQARPDVVQTWLYHADLLGGVAARMAGVPVLIWGVRSSDFLRSYTRFTTRTVFSLCARLSSLLPDCVVYNSNKGREFHRSRGYRERSSQVIPNGIDARQFAPDEAARREVRVELGVADETPLVGMIARFDPLKNHRGFIEAATELHRARPDVHFVLAGQGVDWSNATLAGWIESVNLRGVFHLLGRRDDIARLTASFDIAALASVSEAFPNVLAEAMASGVPCVATNAGDAALILGDTGAIVPVGDMRALAAKMADMLALPQEERRRLGERARSRVMSEFDLEVMANRYLEAYAHVAGRKSSPAKQAART
jgi:glycosyltransferase involved in cell wall biosynthesis